MIQRYHKRVPAVVLAAIACAGLVACSSASSSPSSSSSASGTWSPTEVLTGSNNRVSAPLFAVPKVVDPYEFAFLNPGLSVPTFVDWQLGMNEAAKFYGVRVSDTDLNLKYENALTAYQTLAVKSPVILGTGGGAANAALLSQVTKDGASIVLIDQALDGAKGFGVNDAQAGTVGGQLLVDAAKKRVAEDWAGKSIIYLGVSAANCPQCDARVGAGAAEAGSGLNISSKNQFLLKPDPGTADKAQAVVTDFLTAHPNDKIVILGYGDGGAVGALNALKQANRLDDALVASLGGDLSGRAALRDPSNVKAFVGALDFNPYQEGWNWVEAAIATKLGQPFGTYSVSNVLTPANVNQFYPKD